MKYQIINPETKEIRSREFSLVEVIQGLHWYWRDFMNKGFVSYTEKIKSDSGNKEGFSTG
jgi:hypothetical protein